MRRWLLLLCLCPSIVQATTYYVDNTGGNNANSGLSTGAAWETIGYACTAIASGDTLLIRSGTYAEGSNFIIGAGEHYVMTTTSGSSGDPTVYKGYPGDVRPRIYGDTTSIAGGGDTSSCCILNSFVILDSIEFTHGYRRGVHVDGSRRSIIKNCLIDTIGWNTATNQNPGGISAPLGHVDSLMVHDNWIFDCNSSGIHAEFGPDSMAIFDNVFEDNDAGIFLKVSTEGLRAQDVHIYGNTFIGNTGTRLQHSCAINFSGTGYVYRGLRIHHNLMYGAGFNVFDGAFFIMGGTNPPPPDSNINHYIYIYNNTMDCENQTGNAFRMLSCAKTSGGTPLWDTSGIFNNIIMNADSYNASGDDAVLTNYGFPNDGQGNVGSMWDWDYNMIYDTTGGLDIFAWHVNGGAWNEWTHAEWISNTPYADNDKLDNPDFINQAGRDYHILSSSPAATGGHGGWVRVRFGDSIQMPTYMGAFAPSDTTCPTVTQDLPANGATLADYHVDIVTDFLTDAAGDDIIAVLIGERGDATPEDTIFRDTIPTDSMNWTYNWATTSEDSTYYWYVIGRDTSCADTTPIRNFLVDSIPPSSPPLTIRGTNLRGVILR